MNRRRIGRIARLLNIEQKMLDALVMDLAVATRELSAQQQILDGFKKSLAENLESTSWKEPAAATVGTLEQVTCWSNSIGQSIAYATDQVSRTTSVRDQIVEKVTAQKRVVDGLEKLILKLNEQEDQDKQRIAIAEADDLFLQNSSGRKT
ncbi:MAG: hypothetical protein AAF456_07895 [Planctomycetota bacterium]